MEPRTVLGSDEVRRVVASGASYRVIDVRGRAAFRKAPESVEGDVRAHGVGMMHLVEGQPDETWYLLYCT